MVTMMSTKLTRSGQTTVPKEIRDSLGIGAEARVYWMFDGTRAWVSAEPAMPLSIASEQDFYDRLAEAESSIAEGKVRSASDISHELRERYHLA